MRARRGIGTLPVIIAVTAASVVVLGAASGPIMDAAGLGNATIFGFGDPPEDADVPDGSNGDAGDGSGGEEALVWESLRTYESLGGGPAARLSFSQEIDGSTVEASDFDFSSLPIESATVSGSSIVLTTSTGIAPGNGATLTVDITGNVASTSGGTKSGVSCSDGYNDGSTSQCEATDGGSGDGACPGACVAASTCTSLGGTVDDSYSCDSGSCCVGSSSDGDSGSGDSDGDGDSGDGSGGTTAAVVTEVCNAPKDDWFGSNEIDIDVSIETNDDSGDFQVRLRPPPGIAHVIMPCDGSFMCDNTNNFETLSSGTAHTFSYSTGWDTRALQHFDDGYRVQLRLDSTENQIGEFEVTAEDIPETGNRQCVSFN